MRGINIVLSVSSSKPLRYFSGFLPTAIFIPLTHLTHLIKSLQFSILVIKLFNLNPMRLKPLSLGVALGLMGLLYMLLVTFYPQLSELVFGVPYGQTARQFMMDLYPYYEHYTWYGVLLGLVYGFIDGFVFGALLGLLYNGVAKE